MKEEREKKFRTVIQKRQPNLTVVLENVHDQHNTGAVMRTCDSVGIMEVFVLQTNPDLQLSQIKLGKRTSAGARKWVDVHLYHDIDACFEHLRSKYDHIYATHLGENSKSLYDLDLTQSTALLFGNEHYGVSKAALERCDGNFIIPQMGFVQSLNISVACAVSLYEAMRQRNEKGFYTENPPLCPQQQEILYQKYLEKHQETYNDWTIEVKS